MGNTLIPGKKERRQRDRMKDDDDGEGLQQNERNKCKGKETATS